ncbi:MULTISPECIES: hypothetical protein [unclassified Meridianimarinicoccus]|uniref:hypothetical protein n=1 Tax=unclassified Meridianimarinicoccus TaxID=2923344 RepID=UPI0018666119|nr:hypothetical protein [Fluviibacterium sp. MJW13]
MRSVLVSALALLPLPVLAQERPDLATYEITTGALYQSKADIDGGGSVSASAGVVNFGASFLLTRRTGVGVGVEIGRGRYDFDDVPAIGKSFDYRSDSISLSYDFRLGDTGFGFIAPTVRWNGEIDGDMDKAMTWGMFAGAAWRVSPNLVIGPALGIFSKLDDDVQVFPFLLVEWDITERLQLATGEGLGATQGPGLALTYALNDAWSVGIAGRVENVEFRLDDDASVPDGIARDQSFPLVASVGWEPNDQVRLAAFAGVQTNGRFTLSDKDGRKQVQRDYDNAPIFGAILNITF